DELREQCVDNFRRMAKERAEEIAALIVEPCVQGAAGMIVHPKGFLKGLETICKENDILLICDEVATGFGRTGTMFACEQEDVQPDLMCLAKGLTAGYLPLAATLVSDKVFEAFLGTYIEYKTFFHGHSYTGNALACAAAIACLDIFEKEHVLETLGPKIKFLEHQLATQMNLLDNVGDVRQCGFMVGIELVQDKLSRRPFPPELRMGATVTQNARKHGVILRPLGDVVVIMPPLSISTAQLDEIISATYESIQETCRV
ncbi:MAG: aspartate aminotransferase family protein, partial [Desulfomonilaceae bacterium]